MTTQTTITIGQRIDCGTGDDRDQGTVLALTESIADIGWDSGVRTTMPLGLLQDGIAAAIDEDADTPQDD